MKRFLSLLLCAVLTFNIVFGAVVIAEELRLEDFTKEELEELPEKMVEDLREEYRERQWKIAVDKEKGKTLDQLTTSYLLGDYETGEILKEHNIDELIAIASTSKILTVYVVLDEIKAGKVSKDDLVTIDRDVELTGGASYNLKEGEQKSVEDLMTAAIVVSGNDAVKALAKYIAGSEDQFVTMMEKKLRDIGIDEYNMINSSGLPNYNLEPEYNQNMLTTRGLFELTRSIIKEYPEVLRYASIEEILEPDREYKGENTNPVLGELSQVDGLKTGYTGAAGRCMVATGLIPEVEEKTEEMRVIGITMGSQNDAQRYLAIKNLMEDGLYNYENRVLIISEYPIDTINSPLTVPEQVPVYVNTTHNLVVNVDDDVSYTLDIGEITPPIEPGDQIGTITYYLNGEELFTDPVIIKDKIRQKSWKGWLMRFYEAGFESTINLFGDLNKEYN